MNQVGCNTHIWLHHLTTKQIKALHRRNGKHPKHGLENIFKNHTGCKDFDQGIPPPKPKRLAALDVKYGTSKTKIRFKKVDFTNGSTPLCYWQGL